MYNKRIVLTLIIAALIGGQDAWAQDIATVNGTGIPDSQFKQLEQAAKTGFQNRYAAHRKKVLDRVRNSVSQRVMPGGGRTPSQEAIAEIDFRITKIDITYKLN
jgi:phage FluMu gp28-like protein